MEQVEDVQATLEEEESRLKHLKEKVDVRTLELKVCRASSCHRSPRCDSSRCHLLVAGVKLGAGGEGLLCRPDGRGERCPHLWDRVTDRLANGRRNSARHL